jgi:hypothetical protein
MKLFITYGERYPFPFVHDEARENKTLETSKEWEGNWHTSTVIEGSDEALQRLSAKLEEYEQLLAALDQSGEIDIPGVGTVEIKDNPLWKEKENQK